MDFPSGDVTKLIHGLYPSSSEQPDAARTGLSLSPEQRKACWAGRERMKGLLKRFQ